MKRRQRTCRVRAMARWCGGGERGEEAAGAIVLRAQVFTRGGTRESVRSAARSIMRAMMKIMSAVSRQPTVRHTEPSSTETRGRRQRTEQAHPPIGRVSAHHASALLPLITFCHFAQACSCYPLLSEFDDFAILFADAFAHKDAEGGAAYRERRAVYAALPPLCPAAYVCRLRGA